MRALLCFVAAQLLLACGQVAPVCNAVNCAGCCGADGQCVPLTTDSACGRAGSLCMACGSGQTCSFGQCMATFGAGGGTSGAGGGSVFCGPASCAGCCRSDGSCNLAPTNLSCGAGGQLCRDCAADGQTCSSAFSCVGSTGGGTAGGATAGGGSAGGGSAGGGSAGGGRAGGGSAGGGSAGGGTPFCGPSTCAGCCQSNGTCELAPVDQRCGANGQLCRDCRALGQVCSQATFSCMNAGGGSAGGGSAGGSAGGGMAGGGMAGGSAGGSSAGGSAGADNRLRAFVTSTEFSGNLGGLSGADAKCQTAATAALKGGVWSAFLSSASTTGLSRLSGTGPWYQEDSTNTFLLTWNNLANLQTGALRPLTIDEQGRTIPSTAYFWTGMNDDATTSAVGTCSSWTSSTSDGAVGSLTELSRPNTGLGAPNYCAFGNRILCLEQSRLPRPSPLPTTRKRVFVTSTTFSGNLGGLAGADQRCQTAAAAANKSGTWVAFLASASVSALSRITSTGPWYQEDMSGAFRLTYTNTANLQTGALVPLTLDEQGRTITSTAYFWTGMTDDASTSSIGTCSSWTSATADGAVGSLTELSRPNTGIGAPNYCAYSNRLLCLEL